MQQRLNLRQQRNDDSRWRALVWLAVFAFALLGAHCSRAQAQPVKRAPLTVATLNRAALQAQLDAGACTIPVGTTTIDGPLYVRSRSMLRGSGLASEIKLTGGGEWAVIIAPARGSLYGAYLDSVSITGGGVLWTEFAQHCGMDRVWVSGAPGDGVRLQGDGERLRIRDCVSWENGGAGFAVRCATANNGIVFDHCNAQNNRAEGIVLETTADGAGVSLCIIDDCTIQANGAAQVRASGYVTSLAIRDSWIESTAPGAIGILAEATPAAPPRTSPWRPSGLTISGQTQVALIARAVVLRDAPAVTIDALSVFPATAAVEWDVWQPTGDMRRLGRGQLKQVQPDTLGEAVK